MDAAAASGSLNVIQWTYDLFNSADRPSWFPEPCDTVFSRRIFFYACRGGDVSTLEWLYERKEVLKEKSDGFLISEAASVAKWEAVEWLRNKGFAINFNLVSFYAARYGNLRTLKEARKQGLILLAKFCDEAAGNNQFEVLKWLRKHGCPWGFTTTDRAVSRNFDLLKWAIENDCPTSARCIGHTLKAGDKEMAEWLLQKGCPWPADAVLYASLGKNDSLVDWVLEQDKPMSISRGSPGALLTETTPGARKKLLSRGASLSGKLCDIAARNGDLATLEWLVGIGCPTGPSIEKSAGDNEKVLEWIKWTKQYEESAKEASDQVVTLKY